MNIKIFTFQPQTRMRRRSEKRKLQNETRRDKGQFAALERGKGWVDNTDLWFLRKHEVYARRLRMGVWSQKEYARHAEPLFAFARFADTFAIRKLAIEKTEVG